MSNTTWPMRLGEACGGRNAMRTSCRSGAVGYGPALEAPRTHPFVLRDRAIGKGGRRLSGKRMASLANPLQSTF